MVRKALLGLTVAVAALTAGVTAQAAPLPASISFDLIGSLRATTTSTFDQATGFDFGTGTSPITYGTPGGTVMLGGNVNQLFQMAGFTTGTVGTVQDIANLVVGAQNLVNFYQFTSGTNTLSFTLDNITRINRTAAEPDQAVSPAIAVFGRGSLFLTGYDATPGIFSLTTSNTGVGLTATFQSSVITGAPVSVPEPSSLAILGVALAGLGLVSRRRAS